MLVPSGIMWPFPRSISSIACRKCSGTGGNSRIASLKTWNTIELTLILYSWWERCTCEMHLGLVYKDNKFLIGIDILRNVVSVWASLSDFERLLLSWRIYREERIRSHMWGEAKSYKHSLVGMRMELYLNFCWLTISKMAG